LGKAAGGAASEASSVIVLLVGVMPAPAVRPRLPWWADPGDDDASDDDELGLPWWADPGDDGECGDGE
jgi:hypothetical protein